MTQTLLIVQFVLAVLITIMILLQKSSSMGLGAYSGSNDSMFGAKGPANFLTKLTFILGIVFVVNTLTLGWFYNQEKQKSAIDNVKIDTLIPQVPKSIEAKKTQAPKAPVAPTTPQK
jgi:preprotein translocase subunit SecG